MNNVKTRFAKRKAQYKARGGYKQRPPRTTVNAIVKRAYQTVASSRYLRSQSSKERGYVDLASTQYAFNTTGSITLLNTVAQGAGVQQRIGKKWKMTSLQFRGLLYNNTTAVLNDIAFMIVYDRRPTGSLPAITDILKTVNATSMNNDDNVPNRFQILKRMHTTLIGNTTTPATGMEAVDGDFYLPMQLPVVNKAVGTGAIGDIEEGALYLVTVGNNAAGTAAAIMEGAFRLRFVDM